MKTIHSTTLACFLAAMLLLSSCGKKELQQNAKLPAGESGPVEFAKQTYGDSVQVLAQGDLNSNGKTSALVLVVSANLKEPAADTWSGWIRKGGVIEKDGAGWKVILDFGEKLTAGGKPMLEQIEAKSGYVVSFKKDERPVAFTITMANESGNPVSDDLSLKWNPEKNSYEITYPWDDGTNPQ